MGSRGDFNVDFGDNIYRYRDPGGREGVRNFHGARPKPFHHGGGGFAGAAAGPAGSAVPLVMVAVMAVVVLGLLIGIPLVVIFGIVLPNSSTTDPVVTSAPTVVPPVVPSQPGPGSSSTASVAPPVRVLQVSCPNDIRRGTDPGQSTAIVNWDPPQILSPTVGQVTLTPSLQPNQALAIGTHRVDYTVTDAANNRGTCFFWITVVDDEPPAIQCPPDMTVPTDPGSRSAGVDFPLPTVTENTDDDVRQIMTDDPGDQFHIGQHTVTIVATDVAGNENRCSFTITVQDRETPRITCPADLRANTNDPMEGVPLSWPTPTVSDNDLQNPPTVSCTPMRGTRIPYGRSNVTCVATDSAGNQARCMFWVEVTFNDTEAPTPLTCPASFSVNATLDSNEALVAWVVPTFQDNSQMQPTVTTNIEPNTTLPIGTHMITYTAMDSDGNAGSCSFSVEVVDIQDPTIMCPANFNQDTDEGRPDAVVSLPAATTNDNSVTDLTVTNNPGDQATLNLGDNTVTYTVTDDSGNSASCDITVTIIDNEPPMITCRPLITVRAEEGRSYGNVSFPPPDFLMDNSGGVVNFTTSPASNSMLEIGSHQVIYTATDPSGNTAMCNLTATVVDFETPDLSCPADVNTTTEGGLTTASVSFAAVVIDNSGVVIPTSDYPTGSSFSIGMTVVTFNATDDAGNTATCNFTITVRDEEDPVIMCPEAFSQETDQGQANRSVILPLATASDNSMTMTVTTDPPGSPTLGIGTHNVTYTVTDDSGNSASCDVTVSINDMEDPTLTCPSNLDVRTDPGEAYANVSFPLPSNVEDNSGGEVTITTSPANNSQLAIGTTEVTYTATDPSGNSVECSINVTVVDMEPPNLECPVDNITSTDPGQAFATVTIEPRTLTDNDGNTPSQMSNASSNMFSIGSTTVTLMAQDGAGNEAMCSFIITVQDDEDPVIMCPANFNQSTGVGQLSATVDIPAATASDNSMTPVTAISDPSGSVTLGIGIHTVTYTATDDSGNKGTCNTTIEIIDMEDPTLTCPSNLDVRTDPGEAYANVSFPLPSNVEDNSGGEVTIATSPANNSQLFIGTMEVTYTATDPSGNSVECSINVTVVDMEPPNLECPVDNITSTDPGQAFATVTIEPQTLTDNDGNTPNLTSNASSNMFYVGSTIVTLTALDSAGNENMCSFTITVVDTEPPTLECPDNVTVYSNNFTIPLTFSGETTWTVNVSDNSGLPLVRNDATHESGTLFVMSVNDAPITVTHTAVDTYNNTAQCSFNVRVTGFYTNTSSDFDLEELRGTGAVFHVMSPSYDIGGNYPPSSDVCVRVSAPAGTYIRMRLIALDTEPGDVLGVGSGLDKTAENTTLDSFSGGLPELDDGTVHVKDRVYGDSIWLHFTSDPGGINAGYLLQLDFITNPRDLYPGSYSFCSEFGGFPCLDECVDISMRCNGNNDCANNEDEANCTACTSPLSEDVRFTDTTSVRHINIVSDNYPGEYRPCNATWNIDPTNVDSLRIVVMDIQIGTNDRLYVVNRDTGDQVTPDIDSPVSLHVTGPGRPLNFAVVFTSSGEVRRGFWIQVWRYISGAAIVDFPATCELGMHRVQCGDGSCAPGSARCDFDMIYDCATNRNDEESCGLTADCGSSDITLDGPGSMYHLTSFNYPGDYVRNTDCFYVATAPTASKIHVVFRDLEISTTGLQEDNLSIGNGVTVDAQTIITVSNTFLPEDVVSSGNQIWIRFVTNTATNACGFWIVLVAE